MRINESVISYPGSQDNSGYSVRIYESEVEFTRRDFFEHRHSDFELSCVMCGSGVYSFGNSSERIEEGDVFIFGSNKVHCITDTEPKCRMRLLNVQFEPRVIWSPLANMLSEEYVSLFSGKCEKIAVGSPIHTKVREKLLAIRNESLERRAGYQIMIRAYLCEIIGELMRVSGIDGVLEEGGRRRESLVLMDRAMTYINEHLDTQLSLSDIAAYAGFGRTYFCTLFSSLNGLTPWEYITIRRIERAKELLLSTDLSVLETAQLSGYSNLSNFNRMFARGVGMTPRQYRKSMQKGKIET